MTFPKFKDAENWTFLGSMFRRKVPTFERPMMSVIDTVVAVLFFDFPVIFWEKNYTMGIFVEEKALFSN